MKLNKLFTDDDAVSPVIGVILMVAITVILAAVIGAFVLGLGQGQDVAPTASFEGDTTSNSVELTHKSGETLEDGTIDISVASATTVTLSGDWTAGNTVYVTNNAGTTVAQFGTVGAGNAPSSTVKVIWNSDKADKSSVLFTYEP